MSIDNTVKKILELPDKETFVHREMIWQADWIDAEIGTYADLKAMARLWLMRKQLLKFFADLDSADKTESWARNISERLRKDMEALETE